MLDANQISAQTMATLGILLFTPNWLQLLLPLKTVHWNVPRFYSDLPSERQIRWCTLCLLCHIKCSDDVYNFAEGLIILARSLQCTLGDISDRTRYILYILN